MQRTDATDNVQAYRQLRALLREIGISLDALGDALGYDFETVRSWGKRGRSFPHDPELLRRIVRFILRRERTIH